MDSVCGCRGERPGENTEVFRGTWTKKKKLKCAERPGDSLLWKSENYAAGLRSVCLCEMRDRTTSGGSTQKHRLRVGDSKRNNKARPIKINRIIKSVINTESMGWIGQRVSL